MVHGTKCYGYISMTTLDLTNYYSQIVCWQSVYAEGNNTMIVVPLKYTNGQQPDDIKINYVIKGNVISKQ